MRAHAISSVPLRAGPALTPAQYGMATELGSTSPTSSERPDGLDGSGGKTRSRSADPPVVLGIPYQFGMSDEGVLVMGLPKDPKQRTVYYSYPNMPTSGQVVIREAAGQQETVLQVQGKSWFDRQWGPYSLIDPATHWEWFSLRFFDDEEVMLFAFPQHPYYDGTFFTREGKRILTRNYQYTPLGFTEAGGLIFSEGWELTLPGIKEEKYTINPLMKGQLNLAYYELLAEILNENKEKVGYCFVELLPGVRNPKNKIKAKNLLKKR